ncbi:MAG: trypsin-like peptidase domain-containing protein [Myxococcota bacterium]
MNVGRTLVMTSLALSITELAALAQDRATDRRRSPVVQVVERAGPAVVNISTSRSGPRNPFFRGRGDDFFRRFFGEPSERRIESLGSGVIIDPGGVILTNEHVVARAAEIKVTLSNRRTFDADVIGADREFDLAVLRVRRAEGLPSVDLGRSDDLMPGETVIAIGNPFGLANSVTSGVVSALHRSIEAEDRLYEDFIQTDAAINPGNSGGALLNIFGELIGINTAIYGEANGIGFAIPVDKARAVVNEVLQFGEVRPVYTGMTVDPASRDGARVVRVRGGSPAELAGIRAGDLLVDLSGQEIRSGLSYRRVEQSLVPGQTVTVTLARDGGKMSVDLRVTELSDARALAIGIERLGFDVRPVRTRRGSTLEIVRVTPTGAAARVGIRRGDQLIGAYGRRIESKTAFDRVARSAAVEGSIPLVIGRGNRAYYVNLEL